MITCPISSNLCKKDSKQFYRLHKFPFFRSSHLRCSVRNGALGNFAKFTRKHLWQSLFFDKVTCWGDCFWSFLCLLFKMSCLFHSNRKMRWKKGNTLMELKHLLFCSSIICFASKISKEIWQIVIWSEDVLKENLLLQFSWLEEFR